MSTERTDTTIEPASALQHAERNAAPATAHEANARSFRTAELEDEVKRLREADNKNHDFLFASKRGRLSP